MTEAMTPEQALREIVGGVPHPAVIIAELETAYGYTIVPIDEERDALAELLRLEREHKGRFHWVRDDRYYVRRNGQWDASGDTAVALLAAVKARLGVA